MELSTKEVNIPEGSAKPLAPFSPGIRWDHLVFNSGQIVFDPETGKLTPGGVETETCQTSQNLSTILESAGSSLEQVLNY